MRRILFTIALLATAGLVVTMIAGSSAQGSDSYRFDVIFDDARGLIGGQLVKIAGAQAGTINNVVVTPDYRARVEATVSADFRFHRDATCTIRPQGLIAENYVECDPGTPGTPLLAPQGGHPPTVPVNHTTEPVSLQDLFNIFNLPTRERFQVLLDELGIATAGRGDDVNAVLRRANPTLQLADQVIGILDRQRTQLTTIIDATSRIAAQGAAHTAAVTNFISRASAFTRLTAAHASPLAQAVRRLPALLGAAQPALTQLDTVARQGTPLLSSIDSAVPYLNRVSSDIVPFARVAQPALARINQAITTAIPALRAVRPLVYAINAYIKRSAGNTALFSRLSVNLQAHGFVENFLSVLYYVAAALSRYDSTSHMLSILLIGPDNGMCGNYDSGRPIPACSAHYGSQGAYTPPPRKRRPAAARHGSAAAAHPGTGKAGQPSLPVKPGGTVGRVVKKVLSKVTHTLTTPTSSGTKNLQNLVNYLLK